MRICKLFNSVLFLSVFIFLCMGCETSSSFTPSDSADIEGLIGIIQNEIKSIDSSDSSISGGMKKGEKIQITYESKVKKGSLEMKFTGRDIEPIEFKNNTKGTKTIVIENDGSYSLSVKYDDFMGYYKIYATEEKDKK